MCEQTKDSRDGGEPKSDDVQYKGVGKPFDYDLWDLDRQVIANERIYI